LDVEGESNPSKLFAVDAEAADYVLDNGYFIDEGDSGIDSNIAESGWEWDVRQMKPDMMTNDEPHVWNNVTGVSLSWSPD